jgi:prevent-host-death family protein
MAAESTARFNIHDAKTNLSRIIERVEHGEGIIISRAGTPAAKVVPLTRTAHRTVRGSCAASSSWRRTWTPRGQRRHRGRLRQHAVRLSSTRTWCLSTESEY